MYRMSQAGTVERVHGLLLGSMPVDYCTIASTLMGILSRMLQI